MSKWTKTKIKCMFCEQKRLYTRHDGHDCECYDDPYICKQCCDKHNPNTYLKQCPSCFQYHRYMTNGSIQCASCDHYICGDCLQSKKHKPCFRCGYNDVICRLCACKREYNGKNITLCLKHDLQFLTKKITCNGLTKSGKRCKTITGFDKKYCKRHRYQQKRRIYKK